LPISTAITVGNALRQTQTHESPWMGFAVLSKHELERKMGDTHAFAQLKKPGRGIYVQDVFTPSPAVSADVRVGDFLLSIDGQSILTVAQFQQRLYLSGIGRTVTLEIFRDGEILKKSLTIEKRTRKADEHP
jgi:S1-C subfamily serine protease